MSAEDNDNFTDEEEREEEEVYREARQRDLENRSEMARRRTAHERRGGPSSADFASQVEDMQTRLLGRIVGYKRRREESLTRLERKARNERIDPPISLDLTGPAPIVTLLETTAEKAAAKLVERARMGPIEKRRRGFNNPWNARLNILREAKALSSLEQVERDLWDDVAADRQRVDRAIYDVNEAAQNAGYDLLDIQPIGHRIVQILTE